MNDYDAIHDIATTQTTENTKLRERLNQLEQENTKLISKVMGLEEIECSLSELVETQDTSLARLEMENAELKNRLEIEDETGYDGISCRDETIKLQDKYIGELKSQCIDLKTVLRMVKNTPVNEFEDYGVYKAIETILKNTPNHDINLNITKKEAKQIATQFYYWWHNQQGSNTQDGFDEWWDSIGKDKFLGEQ